MNPVLAASGAALCWGFGVVCDKRAMRFLGSQQVLAWIAICGLAQVLPLAAVTDAPAQVSGTALAWAGASVVSVIGGNILTYAAIQRGAVSLIGPVISLEGAVAALYAVVLGERIPGLMTAGLVLVVVGMLAATIDTRTRERAGEHGQSISSLVLALAGAALWGAFLLTSIKATRELPVTWMQVAYRLGPVCLVAIPLALRGRLPRPGAALPLVLLSAVLQFTGFLLFLSAGDRSGVALAAVVASQFGVVAMLVGLVAFGERLGRLQLGGLAVHAAGIALVASFQGT